MNYPYLSSATYAPDGTVQSMTYGNGAIEANTENARLQPHESALQTDAGGVLENVWHKWYCYGPPDTYCPALGPNRGNIQRVLDLHTNNHSQGFGYDRLDRLTAFNTGDNVMSQSFAYDPWGNMTQAGTQAFQVTYGTNNRITASNFAYDAAGDLTQSNIGVTETFAYDAEGQLTNYDNGGATYTYDAQGQRVREDTAGTWTEYIYWQGVPVAELHPDGTWSDYVFANGKRIARADSYDNRIHIQGTSTASGSYAAWYLPFSGYTIQSGDRLHWRQYQDAAKGGIGISFTQGGSTNWTAEDTDGDVINSYPTELT